MRRFVLFLLALAAPLSAELLARFQTTLGEVEVALEYQQTPLAVANFITLAQATRSRIHPTSGAVIRSPLYVGEKFFRVINQLGFKIAQTGSGTGTNGGGPGFTFKDEFWPTLFHEPYVLSMANGGPNTNGSQIFLTGGVAISALDGVHTVFGKIAAPASRAVIDAILAAGGDGSTITGLTFLRTDSAALAFDEQGQGLPTVTPSGGSLDVIPDVSTTWKSQEIPIIGDIFRAFRSTTLTAGSWSELPAAERHQGFLSPPASQAAAIILDVAAAPAAFYHLSLARHPGSVTPSSLANLRVNLPLGNDLLSYFFNSTGAAGTAVIFPPSGQPSAFPFTTFDPADRSPRPPATGGHHFSFAADTPGLSPRFLLVKAGCDSVAPGRINGHFTAESLQAGFPLSQSGLFTVTPP